MITQFLRHGMILMVFTAPPAAALPAPPKTVAVRKPVSVFAQEQFLSSAQLLARWKPIVTKASRRFGVPAPWIGAVMRMESGGRTMLAENQRMVSDKGAMGLMQLLPATYAEMRAQYRLGPDIFEPRDNIYGGAAYLKWLKGKYGYPAMFAAYNAGPGQVDNLLASGKPLPAETRNYVAGIGDILEGRGGSIALARLTRPDGSPVLIDPVAVRSVRASFEGEYAPGVQTVITMGALKQGVTEDVTTATAAIRLRGGRI